MPLQKMLLQEKIETKKVDFYPWRKGVRALGKWATRMKAITIFYVICTFQHTKMNLIFLYFSCALRKKYCPTGMRC